MLGRKGQGFSWVWAVVAVGIGLFFFTLFWIVLDQARYTAQQPLINIGANAANMQLLDTIWGFSPFLALLGYGIFVYIVANATRGGDYI